MKFELTFEQLQKKLKKVLNPLRFRFIIILYPNTNMIDEIKEHISSIYPQSSQTSLDLKDKSYQNVAPELYKNNEGFVYINDFDEILNNADLYNGFNQRRDKIASFNINLICFISLYQKEELFTKAINVIPDLWEFKNTVLELEKDDNTDKLSNITINESSSYSSIGGITTQDKKIELNKLLQRLKTTNNDELKLNLFNQIATIYRDIGELKNSLHYLKKELNIHKRKNINNTDTATIYNNISILYTNMDDLENALKFQYKSLRLKGDNHPDLGTGYNNLSLIYQNKGDLKNALKFQYKALKLRENPLKKEHINLATSYNNLAMIYRDMGELKKALEYQQKALKINTEILGKRHPILAKNHNNFAMIYRDMGELKKALEYQLRALDIREEILSESHIDLATSYNNLAIIYCNLKEYKKAEEYLQKCIKILEHLDYIHPYFRETQEYLKFIESQIKK